MLPRLSMSNALDIDRCDVTKPLLGTRSRSLGFGFVEPVRSATSTETTRSAFFAEVAECDRDRLRRGPADVQRSALLGVRTVEEELGRDNRG